VLRKLLFSFLLVVLALPLLGSEVDHINIVVNNLDKFAKLFAAKGFVLKKPHTYKAGVQKGLISQAIHFKSGQYIQLMALDLQQKASYGALALWYSDYLKKSTQAQALGIVIRSEKLKKLNRELLAKGIPNRFKELSGYHWLSFKTGTPYQHLSFINMKRQIKRDQQLLAHNSGTLGFGIITVNLAGDPTKWSTILQLSGAVSVGLEFSSLTYQNSGIIQKIILKSERVPCPDSFKLDQIEFAYLCPQSRDKAVI
jgi:hypothetical protein